MFEKLKIKNYTNKLTYALEEAMKSRGEAFDEDHTIEWDYDEKEIYVTVDATDHTFTYDVEEMEQSKMEPEEFVEKVLSDIDRYEERLNAPVFDEDERDDDYYASDEEEYNEEEEEYDSEY